MHIYRIAEMNIAVKAQYEETYRYLAEFLTDNEDYELLIEPTNEMIRYEAELGKEIHGDPGSPYICESVAILRVICDYIIDKGGFFLHCSCLKYKEDAIIFTAQAVSARKGRQVRHLRHTMERQARHRHQHLRPRQGGRVPLTSAREYRKADQSGRGDHPAAATDRPPLRQNTSLQAPRYARQDGRNHPDAPPRLHHQRRSSNDDIPRDLWTRITPVLNANRSACRNMITTQTAHILSPYVQRKGNRYYQGFP